MSFGQGKYDHLVTLVRQHAHAHGAVVLIFEGNRGTGFSGQGSIAFYRALPAALREVADQIEAEIARVPPNEEESDGDLAH